MGSSYLHSLELARKIQKLLIGKIHLNLKQKVSYAETCFFSQLRIKP